MKKTIIAMLLCLSLCLSGCLREGGEGTDTTETLATEDAFVSQYATHTYAYVSEVDEAILKTSLAPAYLLLANKQHALGEGHAPAELTYLTCPTYLGKEVQLDARASAALYEMLDEMRACGVTDISVTSGYRSYAYQSSLFQTYLQREMAGISDDAKRCFSEDYLKVNYYDKGKTALSRADAETVVLSYSAAPGTSEHQTGLCVDFMTSTVSGLNLEFEQTDAFAWLSKNAYKFGFILRYPKGAEPVTGYTYEPWHYRFVGREAATDIYLSSLTLEAYLQAVR